MNVRFLQSISEAYVVDNDDIINITPETVFNELHYISKYLQDYHPELYNEMYESTKLTQQKILKQYLDQNIVEDLKIPDLENEEQINEAVLELSLAGFSIFKLCVYVLATIMTIIYRRKVVGGIMKAISFLGKSIQLLAGFFYQHGKYMQLRYSIVQENSQKCYAHCGITDVDQISPFTYFGIQDKGLLSFGTEKSFKQAVCLRECYIDYIIDLIALHLECYFACLKKTSNFDPRGVNSDDLMKMISSVNLGTACEDYYNQSQKALKLFYDTLDFVYNSPTDEESKLAATNKLRQKVYDVQQMIAKTDQKQLDRYEFKGNSDNRPSFNRGNNNPQRDNRR